MLWSSSSFGRLTKVGGSRLSMTALKYARLTSIELICDRCGDIGSRMGLWEPISVTAMLITVRRASRGGAGAKYETPL